MTFASTAINIVNFVAGAIYVLILARIFISWLPISPWNPLVRLLRTVVDPILRPFRRILPSIGGLDLSPLLAILVVFFIARVVTQALSLAYGGSVNIAGDIIGLIGQLLQNIIIVLGILVLIRLLISLFGADPWHPLVVGVRSMTNPLVRPFAGLGRREFHRGLDIPALATLIAYVVLYVVIEVVFRRLLAGI
ncbi:MAG: YggT family protein [Chloroflexi bacterium]|nr:MAG: YggT family protein [Chloroflexota bacterium]